MSISYLNKSKIKYINNQKYIVKRKVRNIEEIYNELDNRKFINYLKPDFIDKKEEYYKYIDNIELTNEEKSKDIVELMSLLHNRTTSFKDISDEEIKSIYEDTIDRINEVNNYYLKIQDEIEEHIYMSPAELLLMPNISKVYYLLNVSRGKIEDFYNEIKSSKHIRNALIHGNLKLDHILESNEKYLISWNHSEKNIPVYDFERLYRNEINYVEINNLYKEYQKKYKYYKYEESLFLSLISIPKIVLLNKDNLINTINIRNLINYLDKTINFILEKDKEYKESNQNEFE